MSTFVVPITVTSAQNLLYFSARLQRATHNTHGRTPKDRKNMGNETTRRVQVQENEEQIILTAKEEHT